MNFKSLALSAFVALSTFGGVAQAAPTTCFFRSPSDFDKFTCDHVIRTNNNGHNVNDITFFEDGRRIEISIIFWTDANGTPEYAETFFNGKRGTTDAYIAKNGAWCTDNANKQFCVL